MSQCDAQLGVDHAVQQQQARPLDLLPGIEDHVAAGTVVARSGIGRLNLFRAAEFLGAGGHVQRMQPLVVVCRDPSFDMATK